MFERYNTHYKQLAQQLRLTQVALLWYHQQIFRQVHDQ